MDHEACEDEIEAMQMAYDTMVAEKDFVINQQAEQLKVLQEAAEKYEFDMLEIEYWRNISQKHQRKFNVLYSH